MKIHCARKMARRRLRIDPAVVQKLRRRFAAQQSVLREIARGEKSVRVGVKSCWCKRQWTCAKCSKPFQCWATWNTLWRMMPPRWRNTKLCRRCYGQKLLAAVRRYR